MSIENRKSPRRKVLQGAMIFRGGGQPSVACTMLDLSEAGARLKVVDTAELPDEFILVLTRDKQLNRRCRAVWRHENEVGVKFLDWKAPGPVRTRKPSEHTAQAAVPEMSHADSPAGEPETAAAASERR